jgi:hypothetical protein
MFYIGPVNNNVNTLAIINEEELAAPMQLYPELFGCDRISLAPFTRDLSTSLLTPSIREARERCQFRDRLSEALGLSSLYGSCLLAGKQTSESLTGGG